MKIIEEFIKVRDLPYRIPLSSREADDCCTGKALRLYETFKKAGLEVRYRICSFLWSDLNLPAGVLALPHIDEGTHSYLEVKIGNNWKIVDATWDKALERIFTISDWDGLSDTALAVPARSFLSPEESATIMATCSDERLIAEDLEKNGQFYKGFNVWLDKIRNYAG